MRLIPALDLRGGGVVRLEQGAFDRERRYAEAPEAWLDRFAAAGAEWVHVVDLDRARDGEGPGPGAARRLLGRGVQIQVAGGVRSRAAAERWLSAGAGRVVVGSAAVERPDEVAAWIAELGAEKIVVALDARRTAEGGRVVSTHGWLRDSDWSFGEAAARFADAGARHALATAIERDGRLAGPDLELHDIARRTAPGIAWQASGGVRHAADLAALAAAGAAAAIVGRALLDGRLPLSEIARWSPDASSPVST